MKTWAAIAIVAGVIEARAMRRHEGTLSECTARIWHTETPLGRAAWTASLGVATAAVWWHIVRFEYSGKAGQ